MLLSLANVVKHSLCFYAVAVTLSAISWPQAHEKLSIIIKDTALVDCLSAVVLEILSESHEEV